MSLRIRCIKRVLLIYQSNMPLKDYFLIRRMWNSINSLKMITFFMCHTSLS